MQTHDAKMHGKPVQLQVNA